MHIPKFIDVVRLVIVSLVLLVIVGGIIFLIVYPIVKNDMIMFYINAFLILFFIQTLGILRLYNAVFHNTKFMVSLSKAMNKWLNEVPALERLIRDDTTAQKRAVSQLHDTIQAIKNGSVKIDLLNDEIEKWRRQQQNININGNNSANNSSNHEVK